MPAESRRHCCVAWCCRPALALSDRTGAGGCESSLSWVPLAPARRVVSVAGLAAPGN